MAWRRPGDKPLSEPMMVSLLTHICVTRPQWVKVWDVISHPCLNVSSRLVNSLRPRLNRRPPADDIFKCIFLNENEWISPRISLKFVPNVRINNIPALVQIMAWRRPGDKPLSEPKMVNLLTHICVTRPQWVKQMEQSSMLIVRTVNLLREQNDNIVIITIVIDSSILYYVWLMFFIVTDKLMSVLKIRKKCCAQICSVW